MVYKSTNGIDEMATRRQARRLALQALFVNEFLKEDPLSILERVAQSLGEEIQDFTRELIVKTTENRAVMNKLIKQHLINWELHRIAVLDKMLISMALTEIIFFPDIPVEVTINEALEISKEFSNFKSRKFVNGILDSIYKDLNNSNKLQKFITAHSSLNRGKSSPRKGNST